MGALFLAADALLPFGGAAATEAAAARAAAWGWPGVAAGYGLLASNLALSAALYSSGAGYGYGAIAAGLLATWTGSWWLLDRTRQGAALAVLCALGAPAAELVLMGAAHTWHYSRPDVLLGLGGGFVSFVPCCYGGYVPLLALFTRTLVAEAPRAGGAPQPWTRR
jgi:hypothetical protein